VFWPFVVVLVDGAVLNADRVTTGNAASLAGSSNTHMGSQPMCLFSVIFCPSAHIIPLSQILIAAAE